MDSTFSIRRALIGLAMTVAVVASPGVGHADVSLHAGAGPRFSAGTTAAVGSLRLGLGRGIMPRLIVEVNGYLSSEQGGESFTFAGGQLGLGYSIPIPGPITPELAVAAGWLKLDPSRHGTDESLATINTEVGLSAALGPVSLRGAWTYAIWREDATLAARAMRHQLIFGLGVTL